MPSDESENVEDRVAYARMLKDGTLDQCSVTLLVGKAVRAPFVGATAATLVVSGGLCRATSVAKCNLHCGKNIGKLFFINSLRYYFVEFYELNNEQRRRLVDVRQLYEARRAAALEFYHGYRGTMHWRRRAGGEEYLYRIVGKTEHSLGPRGQKTDGIKADHDRHREILKGRIATLDGRIRDMARVNRALGIGHVPTIAARILRRLDAAGLLGRHLFVVGTHALFAYEAAAGIVFESGLTATTDVDLLWDARRRLSLALVDVREEGVLGLLRKIDRTFTAQRGSFRAVNDEGYYVDIIRAPEKEEMRAVNAKITAADDDIEAATIAGLQWLINVPKFEQIVVGADGRPLWMSCVDPRAFALHKYWISQRADRDPLKRRRDVAQARAVALMAVQYLGLEFDAKELSALPAHLVQASEALLVP